MIWDLWFVFCCFLARLPDWTADGNSTIKESGGLTCHMQQIKSKTRLLLLTHNFARSWFVPRYCWATCPLFAEGQGPGTGRPKCLHLSDRCYVQLLQITWLSKMLIKTSNNLHFVYSNLHNCTVTQCWALLPRSDFHQLFSFHPSLMCWLW